MIVVPGVLPVGEGQLFEGPVQERQGPLLEGKGPVQVWVGTVTWLDKSSLQVHFVDKFLKEDPSHNSPTLRFMTEYKSTAK